MYTQGEDRSGDPVALRVDATPIDGQRLSGTFFVDDGRQWEVTMEPDRDFAGFVLIRFQGFPWSVWSWVEVLEGGARLDAGLESLGFFPGAPEGLNGLHYMPVSFWL